MSLTVETFTPAVGGRFVTRWDGALVELELAGASALGGGPPGGRAPFRLEFRGPAEPLLAQQIHRLESTVLEPLEIFLVPVGRDARGATYEAIFN